MATLPAPSSVVLTVPENGARAALARLGFRAAGPQMIRVDMAERLARHAFEVKAGKEGETVDGALVVSLGLHPEAVDRLMRDIGFRPDEGEGRWVWRGRERGRRRHQERSGSPAFAALAELRRRPRG
jgi:ATP-dependent RNA helicase SUPV3L1/SUV3